MNTQYSSLEDAFPDKPWPTKKHVPMTSSQYKPEQKRDAEKEGRVFPTPIHRGQNAIQKHKKTIDDLSNSLPIVNDDEETNFAPAKIAPTKEHFGITKTSQSNVYYPNDDGTDYAYAPPAFQRSAHEVKLNRILQMVEQNRTGYETPGTQDMLLYIFTGVFFLFTFDTFVNLGKHIG
jgi:hypothetical protein